MYEIIVKGDAETIYPNLKELDGISDDQKFSNDFGDEESSFSDVVSGGYLKFKFEDGKLFSTTVYDSNRKLTADELEKLKEYTTGQWSDGIGEGFEQFPCHTATQPFNKYIPKYADYKNQAAADRDRRVFVSPWHKKQVTTITQKMK